MKIAALLALGFLAATATAQGRYDLSNLERASGWTSMCDEESRSSWNIPLQGWTFAGAIVSRAEETVDDLVWKHALFEFEIDFDWRAGPGGDVPWQAGRIVVRSDNSALALLGEQRIDRAAQSDLPSFPAGPFEMTPGQKGGGWQIVLKRGEAALELRGLRLRDRAKEIGKAVDIFDGATLKGWRALGDAKFSVENGELLGEVGGGAQSFLCTEREFGDFVFEVELKNELPGNSGIQVRSHENGQKRLFGYQIEVDPSARAWSGGLYDEARRGWLDDLAKKNHGRAAFKSGQWNRFRIECIGPWIRAWVNDVPTADYLDGVDLSGLIGLQVHSGQNTKIRWRNFRLRELDRSRWVSFDTSKGPPMLGAGSEDGSGEFPGKHRIALDIGGDLLLKYGYSGGPERDGVIERIRLVGSDWAVTASLEKRAMGAGTVMIFCHPPRIAIEIDGKRIHDLEFERGVPENVTRIEAWVDYGRNLSLDSAQELKRE